MKNTHGVLKGLLPGTTTGSVDRDFLEQLINAVNETAVLSDAQEKFVLMEMRKPLSVFAGIKTEELRRVNSNSLQEFFALILPLATYINSCR